MRGGRFGHRPGCRPSPYFLYLSRTLELIYPLLFYISLGYNYKCQTSILDFKSISLAHLVHIPQRHLLSHFEKPLPFGKCIHHQLVNGVFAPGIPFWRTTKRREHPFEMSHERCVFRKLWDHVRRRVLRIQEEHRQDQCRRIFCIPMWLIWVGRAIRLGQVDEIPLLCRMIILYIHKRGRRLPGKQGS